MTQSAQPFAGQPSPESFSFEPPDGRIAHTLTACTRCRQVGYNHRQSQILSFPCPILPKQMLEEREKIPRRDNGMAKLTARIAF